MTKLQQLSLAEARLAAANKHVLAAAQRENAQAHREQAYHPAYAGQDIICLDKADRWDAIAARTEAEADLIIARAEAEAESQQGEKK